MYFKWCLPFCLDLLIFYRVEFYPAVCVFAVCSVNMLVIGQLRCLAVVTDSSSCTLRCYILYNAVELVSFVADADISVFVLYYVVLSLFYWLSVVYGDVELLI